MASLKFTGERMVPELNKNDIMYAEHMCRYFFVSQFIKDKVVLDIACGTGYGCQYLLNKGAKKVIGIDISQEAIDYAKKKYQKKGIEFLQGDAENIPLKNEAVDVVVSFETIEHLKNQGKFLKEVKRILKKDGLALISTPNTLVSPEDNEFHTREFAPKDFKEFLLKYFKNLKLYYQNNVTSSYILSEKNVKLDNKEIKTKNIKLAKTSPDQNLFLLAIASDNSLPPKIEELMASFTDELEKKLRKLQDIYGFRGWKVVSFLHRIKKSIPILKKL